MHINVDVFKSAKTSDTIFVLGSGYSVNKVTNEEWDIVSRHNSIAFNWFCYHSFEPTYYLIREQANIPSRRNKVETVDNFIKLINRYRHTIGVIVDVSHHTKQAHKYHKDKRIKLPCLIVKDDKSKRYRKIINMNSDPTKTGLIHGTTSMYGVLHLIRFLGYSNIVFIGVDLYDSRYFWLGKKQTRHTVAKKNKKFKDTHAVAKSVIKLVNRFKNIFGVNVYYTNPKSMLCKCCEFRAIGTFS